MRLFLPIFVLLLSPLAAQADSCSALKNDPLYMGLVGKLNEARDSHVEIFDFRIYDIPILLTTNDAPLCIALYQKGQVEFFTLAQPLMIPNGYYDFRNEFNKLSQDDERRLSFLIEGRKMDAFLIYKIDKTISDEYEKDATPVRAHFAFLVHEGFHLFGQGYPIERSLYKPGIPYVSWTREGKIFIKENCYGPRPDVSRAKDLEMELLKTAINQIYINDDPTAAVKTLQSFLATRETRYALLKDSLFFPDSWFAGESCARGEAVMEYLEGTAKFVEFIYLLQTNLIRVDQWLNPRINKYLGSDYYILGALQLALLYKMDPQFSSLTPILKNDFLVQNSSFYTARIKSLLSTRPKNEKVQ